MNSDKVRELARRIVRKVGCTNLHGEPCEGDVRKVMNELKAALESSAPEPQAQSEVEIMERLFVQLLDGEIPAMAFDNCDANRRCAGKIQREGESGSAECGRVARRG